MKKQATTTVKHQRMTNNIRESFVSAVMADVPKTDYEQRIRDAVAKLIDKATPASVKKMLADENTNPWINTLHITLGRYQCNEWEIDFPSPVAVSLIVRGPSAEWFYQITSETIRSIAKEWRESIDTRARLKNNLSAVTSNCTTTTQVAEAFPEFASYLPQSEAAATRSLPALANVVSDLVQAGWPKGKPTQRIAA